MRTSGYPTRPLTVLLIALPVLVFILLPVVAMLRASVEVSVPMAEPELVARTAEALALVDEDRRPTLDAWWASADREARLSALAAAFVLRVGAAPWDTSRRFAAQERAAEAALAAATAADRAAMDASLPLVHAALERRAVIAALAEPRLGATKAAELRSGVTTRLGLDHYLHIVSDPRLRRAALNTLALATTSAGLATLIGFVVAFGVHRGLMPGAAIVRVMILLPLVSPPVMLASATIMLFGRQGLVTHTVLDQGLGWIDAATTNIYGLGGVVAAQVLGFIGPVFIVLSATLARRDPAMEEAAASLGAGYGATLGQVLLPLAMPGIARAFMLAFVLALTDFGNPNVIGENVTVIAGEIYGQIVVNRNHPLAAALCVAVLAPAGLVYALVELAGRRRRFHVAFAAAGAGIDPPPAMRILVGVVGWAAASAIGALFAVVIAGAFVRVWGVDYGFTLAHFLGRRPDEAFAGTAFGTEGLGVGTVLDSLRVAALAAPIGAAFAIVLAYVLERWRPPGHAALGFVVMLPAVLPGLIFGIGYLVAFNDPFGQADLALTGTLAILVLNVLFGNLFVGVLAVRAALKRVDPAAEDAAETLGAGLATRLFSIVLPAVRHACILGGLYIFVDGLTTFSSVIFLVSGEWRLASVEIFNQAGAAYGAAAAKTVALLGIVALVLVAIWRAESGTAKHRHVSPVQQQVRE